jgi:glycosyltransferase involved in cell wall biosynthesis
MRVLHVIQTLSARYGGPVASLKALTQYQVRSGLRVTICTTNADYPKGYLPVATDRPVLERGVTIWFHRVCFQPLLVSAALGRWLDHGIKDFDVVHIHGLYRFPVTYAAWAARKARVPYVITPHGALDPFLYRQSRHSVLLKRLYERLFDFPNIRNASAINYTTREELERARFLGLSPPAVVIPSGMDGSEYTVLPRRGSFRSAMGIPMETPLVLYLGRINFKKGLDLLIPAFSLVLESLPTAQLVLVGPDNEGYGRRIQGLCGKHGIASATRFVGYIDAERVRQAYVDADVFVLPSYSENFGRAVVEAMACGCPVIISDKVNLWREVKRANAGIVTRLDARDIARAILSVLNADPDTAGMGASGRDLARRRFAYDAIADRVQQMYADISSGKGPGIRCV